MKLLVCNEHCQIIITNQKRSHNQSTYGWTTRMVCICSVLVLPYCGNAVKVIRKRKICDPVVRGIFFFQMKSLSTHNSYWKEVRPPLPTPDLPLDPPLFFVCLRQLFYVCIREYSYKRENKLTNKMQESSHEGKSPLSCPLHFYFLIN